MLCNSQFLKSEYIKKIESLPKQERLNEAADMYCVLGDIENATGDIESAKDAYSEAESRYKETDNLGLGRVWYGRGELNRKLNRWDKAETAYSQATDYYERANSRQGRAAVQLALGHIKRSTDDPVLTR